MRRWTPLKFSFFQNYPWFRPSDWSYPPLTEQRRFCLQQPSLASARSCLSNSTNVFSLSASNAIIKANRKKNLESQMVGGEGEIYLAAKNVVPDLLKTNSIPLVTNVVPSSVTIDPKGTNIFSFAFFGTALGRISTKDPDKTAAIPTLKPSPITISNLTFLCWKRAACYNRISNKR